MNFNIGILALLCFVNLSVHTMDDQVIAIDENDSEQLIQSFCQGYRSPSNDKPAADESARPSTPPIMPRSPSTKNLVGQEAGSTEGNNFPLSVFTPAQISSPNELAQAARPSKSSRFKVIQPTYSDDPELGHQSPEENICSAWAARMAALEEPLIYDSEQEKDIFVAAIFKELMHEKLYFESYLTNAVNLTQRVEAMQDIPFDWAELNHCNVLVREQKNSACTAEFKKRLDKARTLDAAESKRLSSLVITNRTALCSTENDAIPSMALPCCSPKTILFFSIKKSVTDTKRIITIYDLAIANFAKTRLTKKMQKAYSKGNFIGGYFATPESRLLINGHGPRKEREDLEYHADRLEETSKDCKKLLASDEFLAAKDALKRETQLATSAQKTNAKEVHAVLLNAENTRQVWHSKILEERKKTLVQQSATTAARPCANVD